jgi:hypothetical protein
MAVKLHMRQIPSGSTMYPYDPVKQYAKRKAEWTMQNPTAQQLDFNRSQQGFRPLQSNYNPAMELAPTTLPSVQNQTSDGFMGTVKNLGSQALGTLSTNAGMAGMAGAATGLIGGLLGNQEIKSQNAAINNSINTMQSQLNELKKQREDATKYRRGEATDFLTQYVTARDPNRSSQIAQMYSTGQDRYRSELQNYDQMQSQFNANIAQLQSQKQKEKTGWEIVGEGLLGVGQMLPYMLMG